MDKEDQKARTHYFGVWSDPQAALESCLAERDNLDQRPPSPFTTLADLLNASCRTKVAALEEGSLPVRQTLSFEENDWAHATASPIAEVAGEAVEEVQDLESGHDF